MMSTSQMTASSYVGNRALFRTGPMWAAHSSGPISRSHSSVTSCLSVPEDGCSQFGRRRKRKIPLKFYWLWDFFFFFFICCDWLAWVFQGIPPASHLSCLLDSCGAESSQSSEKERAIQYLSLWNCISALQLEHYGFDLRNREGEWNTLVNTLLCVRFWVNLTTVFVFFFLHFQPKQVTKIVLNQQKMNEWIRFCISCHVCYCCTLLQCNMLTLSAVCVWDERFSH